MNNNSCSCSRHSKLPEGGGNSITDVLEVPRVIQGLVDHTCDLDQNILTVVSLFSAAKESDRGQQNYVVYAAMYVIIGRSLAGVPTLPLDSDRYWRSYYAKRATVALLPQAELGQGHVENMADVHSY